MISLLGPLPGTSLDTSLGLFFLGLALLTVTVLTVLYAIKMATNWTGFLADLFTPGQGAQTAAWPASLLISALATGQAGLIGTVPASLALPVATVLASIGFLGTLASGLAFFSHVIGQSEVPAQAITAGWFVPVVPLVLVPSIVLRLTSLTDNTALNWTVWIAVSSWGMGFGLFMLLAAIIGGRLLMREPPAAHALPSWWAWLAPLGAGGMGMVTTARLTADESIISLTYWLASAIWGFSAWWVLFALVVIYSHRREASFHLGYWGFGFPTAAFASLSLEVGRFHGFVWLETVASVFWGALLVLVAWLVWQTVGLWRKGALFPSPTAK
jgi:tellurite resistance protein TehA-like permease